MNIFNKVLKYDKDGKCETSKYKGLTPLEIKAQKKREKKD